MIQNANTSIYKTHAYIHFTMDRQQTVCCTNFFLILLKFHIIIQIYAHGRHQSTNLCTSESDPTSANHGPEYF